MIRAIQKREKNLFDQSYENHTDLWVSLFCNQLGNNMQKNRCSFLGLMRSHAYTTQHWLPEIR